MTKCLFANPAAASACAMRTPYSILGARRVVLARIECEAPRITDPALLEHPDCLRERRPIAHATVDVHSGVRQRSELLGGVSDQLQGHTRDGAQAANARSGWRINATREDPVPAAKLSIHCR